MEQNMISHYKWQNEDMGLMINLKIKTLKWVFFHAGRMDSSSLRLSVRLYIHNVHKSPIPLHWRNLKSCPSVVWLSCQMVVKEGGFHWIPVYEIRPVHWPRAPPSPSQSLYRLKQHLQKNIKPNIGEDISLKLEPSNVFSAQSNLYVTRFKDAINVQVVVIYTGSNTKEKTQMV